MDCLPHVTPHATHPQEVAGQKKGILRRLLTKCGLVATGCVRVFMQASIALLPA